MLIHNCALIGHGYWGSKVAERILDNPRMNLMAICDPVAKLPRDFNHTPLQDILDDPAIELVAIMTPPSTHFDLCRQALLAKKHVMITKPFVTRNEDCLNLLALADVVERKIFLDCTYLFMPVVQTVKEKLDFHPTYIQYINANRWTGNSAPGVSIIDDLCPHIISMLKYWFPWEVCIKNVQFATVATYQDTAFITLTVNSTIVNIMVSWASPTKQRVLNIVGKDKMISFDLDGNLDIYDNKREGAKIVTTAIDKSKHSGDALVFEIEHIADCLDGKTEQLISHDRIWDIVEITSEIKNFHHEDLISR